jgi:16S rRNA processing protein RimM
MQLEELLEIGKVLKPWGLKGCVKVFSYAESPATFRRLSALYIQTSKGPEALAVDNIREHKNCVVLKFKDRNSVEEVQDLITETLFMHKRDLSPLEEGEYYWHDLIGMAVVTDGGKYLGVLEHIFNAGSSDIYVVQEGEREYLIPAIRDVILQVDVPGKRMIIHPIQGLLNKDDF